MAVTISGNGWNNASFYASMTVFLSQGRLPDDKPDVIAKFEEKAESYYVSRVPGGR